MIQKDIIVTKWSIHLLLHDVTTVTVSTMVQVQFTSDLCKM